MYRGTLNVKQQSEAKAHVVQLSDETHEEYTANLIAEIFIYTLL